MGKIKNFMQKPITYGAVIKSNLWAIGIYAGIIGGYVIYDLYQDRKYYKEKYYKEIGLLPDDDSETVVDDEEIEAE